jgi:cell fate regulator YaaT (PSP1 superfamily)
MAPFIIGLRFQKIGKLYHFDASQFRDVQPGDFVVVDTSRGTQLGEVMVSYDSPPPPPPDGSWKPIERRATPRDLVLRQVWGKKELEATINCRAKLSEMGIEGVKIVASEFSFDGSRLSLLYSSESGDRQELNKLRSAMQRSYNRTKVEMRQIGPRDVAKIIGGMGACGLETRCCSQFLTEFSPVSIKMAKEQGISLTPSEITGMCGRLRCCLVYEYEQYVAARKMLPKRGKKVVTPLGDGKVLDTYPLKQAVLVEIADGNRHEFMKHELEPWDELEALRRKSEGPCDRHENGGCDCGKAGAESAGTLQAVSKLEVDETLQNEVESEVDDMLGLQQSDDDEKTRPTGGDQAAQSQNRSHKNKYNKAGKESGTSAENGSAENSQKQRGRRPYRRKGSKRNKSHKPNANNQHDSLNGGSQ